MRERLALQGLCNEACMLVQVIVWLGVHTCKLPVHAQKKCQKCKTRRSNGHAKYVVEGMQQVITRLVLDTEQGGHCKQASTS